MPEAINSSATQEATPVEKKTNSQMLIEKMTGNGYNHILKGRFAVPFLFLNNTTPIACATN